MVHVLGSCLPRQPIPGCVRGLPGKPNSTRLMVEVKGGGDEDTVLGMCGCCCGWQCVAAVLTKRCMRWAARRGDKGESIGFCNRWVMLVADVVHFAPDVLIASQLTNLTSPP